MDFWLAWWREIALAKHGLEHFIAHIDWLPTLAALARQLDGDAIARGVDTVTGTKSALEANANARLALDVMMLDLPYISPSSLPIAKTAVSVDGPPVTVQE